MSLQLSPAGFWPGAPPVSPYASTMMPPYPQPTSYQYPYRQESLRSLTEAPVSPEISRPLSPAPFKRLFHHLSPLQGIGLFTAGLVSATALGWFTKGLGQNPKQLALSLRALQHPAQSVERQTAVYFQKGLESVVMMAVKYPALRTRLKAYIGAGVLGYAAGSIAKGAQEVWIRREEAQIRANLLTQLQDAFRDSLRLKVEADSRLKQDARQQLQRILEEHGVAQASELLTPVKTQRSNTNWRFPYEPVHFNSPVPSMAGFSGQKQHSLEAGSIASSQGIIKLATYGLGLGTGILAQGLNRILASNHLDDLPDMASKALRRSAPRVKQTLLELTNAHDREALFLMGNNKILVAVLGLTAAARVGKLLIDGYREIEVTRRNAATELTYQHYNWKQLDPSFHSIAEQEALRGYITQFTRNLQQVPQLQLNRPLLQHMTQSILDNIGRESAPRYFPMTPSINLVDARG